MTVPDHLISPRFPASKASPGVFEDWVDIYEDRTWGWLLKYADSLLSNGPDAKIAALHLAVSFIEPYEVYRTGTSSDRRSRTFFRSGFAKVFNRHGPGLPQAHMDAATDAIYEEVRCGLFHRGLPGSLVYLSNAPRPVQVQLEQPSGMVRQIALNPDLFVEAVITEFRLYIARLRDVKHPEHAQLRACFEQAWHLVHRRTP